MITIHVMITSTDYSVAATGTLLTNLIDHTWGYHTLGDLLGSLSLNIHEYQS